MKSATPPTVVYGDGGSEVHWPLGPICFLWNLLDFLSFLSFFLLELLGKFQIFFSSRIFLFPDFSFVLLLLQTFRATATRRDVCHCTLGWADAVFCSKVAFHFWPTGPDFRFGRLGFPPEKPLFLDSCLKSSQSNEYTSASSDDWL